jgi:hypothetical protein
MRLRRKRLLSVLQEDEICPTVTAFPLLGVGTFTSPELPAGVRIAYTSCREATHLTTNPGVLSNTIHEWLACFAALSRFCA